MPVQCEKRVKQMISHLETLVWIWPAVQSHIIGQSVKTSLSATLEPQMLSGHSREPLEELWLKCFVQLDNNWCGM